MGAKVSRPIYTPGQRVQTVNVQSGVYSTFVDPVIPDDNTIPQQSEGAEIMTLSITPKASANKLMIEVALNWSLSLDKNGTFALFQDATANALFACQNCPHTAWSRCNVCHFRFFMTAGTTSATTFKVRGGTDSAGATLRINGDTSAKMGGVMISSITITEIKA